MHDSAYRNAKRFFEVYGAHIKTGKVVEIGAQDVNGTIRTTAPPWLEYVGVDYQAGKGVDLVLEDQYTFPFEDESVDILVSSSCLEHSAMFWVTWLEMLRVVKPNGLIYLNVPSAGDYHGYPVDCWRFQSDAHGGLIQWAIRHGYRPCLLESYIEQDGPWRDWVGIFCKTVEGANGYPERIGQDK